MTHRLNLTVKQGQTLSEVYTKLNSAGSAVDLTGYTARMSIKAGYSGGNEAYLSTGSDANGGTLTLGGAAGTITIAMTAAQTAALAGDLSYFLFAAPEERAGRYIEFIYDLELINGATVTRELEGSLTVQREVTS